MLTYERGDDHDTFCHLVVCFRKSVYRKSNDKLVSRGCDKDIGQPSQKMLAFFNQPLEKTPLTNMELQLTESHYAGVSGYEFNNGNVNGLNDSIPKIRDRNGNEQIQFQN